MSKLPLSHPINGVMGLLLGWVIFGTGSLLPALCILAPGLAFITFYHYKAGARFLPSFLLLSGPVYIGTGMAAILALAKFTPLLLLWALLVVWTTDTAAYITGNLVGGPKLVPRISPGKTWSGLAGGSMAGSALGVTLAPYCQIPVHNEMALSCFAILITLVAHGGDILESGAKRLFKAKDSSHLVPGHGGLLDRMDSLLLVALFLVTLQYFNAL